MATIDECFKLLKYRATKSGFNGNISPDDFNLVFPRAEVRFFNTKYKTYQVSQENTDSILMFKTDPVTITIGGDGKYTKPASFLHVVAITHVLNGKEVEITEWLDDRLGNKISSTYDAPNEEFPIYTEYKTYLQFRPITLGTAKLVSLQSITPSKWAYTVVNNRPVYDPVNSVQPRYDDTYVDEIIYLAGVDLGLNLRDQMVLQVNDVKAKENA